MAASDAESHGVEDHPTGDGPIPEFIDWFLAAIVALGGLMAIIGGTAVMLLVDQDAVAEEMEAGDARMTVFTRELTQAESVAVAEAVITWTGIGLLVTGVGMLVFAIGFVLWRHRAYRRARTGDPLSSYWTYALVGGFATALLSFIPISPLFGGALSGYLERGESNRTLSVGALAGLLPVVPLVVLIAFVLGGVVAGLMEIGEDSVALFMAVVLIFSIAFTAIVAAGLGAGGGYLGGLIAERRSDPQ